MFLLLKSKIFLLVTEVSVIESHNIFYLAFACWFSLKCAIQYNIDVFRYLYRDKNEAISFLSDAQALYCDIIMAIKEIKYSRYYF